MADGIVLSTNIGTGATIKTDDDGTYHWQLVKVAFGGDNTQTEVTSSVGLPVSDAGGSLTVDNASLSVTGGGVEASALRVTLASDSTGVLSIDDNGGSLTVDGTVTANLSATDNAVLDQIELNTSYGDSIGGGTEAAALRVTLANDSTGLISIDDNGGSITIDGTVTANAGTGTFTVDGSGVTQPVSGTVTANLGATDNAVLDQIEVNTSYGDTLGGGTEAAALRVTLANDSTGVLSIDDNGGSITVDNGGTFAVQSTLSAETTKVIGTVNVAAAQTIAVTNAGTFATQATLQAGTAEIGKLAAGVAEIGNVKNSGTFAVQSTLQTGSAAIGKLAANSGVDIGDVDVTSISAGANLIGDVGLSGARTSGGTTLYKNIDVDESEDQVKATGGQIYWIHAINLNAAVRYLKIYNATAASVTVGTTVPDLTFPIPANSTTGAGFVLPVPNGIAFSTAITIAATTGVADADSGAPGANEVIVNLGYA